MNNLSTIRMPKLLSLGLALCVGAGCASFSDAKLPKRNLADLERAGKLVEVTYEFAEGSFSSAGESLTTMNRTSANTSVLQARVEPIFRRVFVESTHQQEPGEWHLDMYYRETARNPAITYTLAVFFICSLGILPAYAQDDLYLEVKLRHYGQTVRQYIYEERVATWLHWFVLPWSFSNDPMEQKAAIIDNMILNLIHELRSELPQTAPGG